MVPPVMDHWLAFSPPSQVSAALDDGGHGCCRPSEAVPSFRKQLLICSPPYVTVHFFLPILLFQLQILPPPNYKQRVWPLIKDSVRTCLSLLCLVSLQIPGMRPASHFTNIEDNTHDSSCKAAATEKFHQVYSLEGLRHSPWRASKGMGEEEEK